MLLARQPKVAVYASESCLVVIDWKASAVRYSISAAVGCCSGGGNRKRIGESSGTLTMLVYFPISMQTYSVWLLCFVSAQCHQAKHKVPNKSLLRSHIATKQMMPYTPLISHTGNMSPLPDREKLLNSTFSPQACFGLYFLQTFPSNHVILPGLSLYQ